MDLQIGVPGIDDGRRFDHEIGEVGGVEGDKGQRQTVDEPPGPRRQVREGERTGVDLVEVVLAAGIHRLHRAFDQRPQPGVVVADLGLRDQRREAVGLLADRGVRGQLADHGAFDEVQVVAAEHLRVRQRFPVAVTEVGVAPENQAVPGAEDRQEIVVVPVKQVLLVEGVLALAGGGLVEILTDPLPVVDDAGARLDPEAHLVGAPLPDQERASVIKRGHADVRNVTHSASLQAWRRARLREHDEDGTGAGGPEPRVYHVPTLFQTIIVHSLNIFPLDKIPYIPLFLGKSGNNPSSQRVSLFY